jgi:hypothetical protein
MTLVELLIASSMLMLLAGVVGGLASAVETSSYYSQGHADAAQHARVALERITREIGQATAVGGYAGFAVVSEVVGTASYPDTLLVWRPPNGMPANPDGPPLVSELVIYCPHPQQPEQLLEIRAPQDTRTIPLDESLNESPWWEMVAAIKTDAQSQRVVLTDLLRVAKVTSSKLISARRAAVRFIHELRPATEELDEYRNGGLPWADLAWPQGMYSPQTAMRQSWLRIELQLMPGAHSREDTTGIQAVPFLGSAALYYQVLP